MYDSASDFSVTSGNKFVESTFMFCGVNLGKKYFHSSLHV